MQMHKKKDIIFYTPVLFVLLWCSLPGWLAVGWFARLATGLPQACHKYYCKNTTSLFANASATDEQRNDAVNRVSERCLLYYAVERLGTCSFILGA